MEGSDRVLGFRVGYLGVVVVFLTGGAPTRVEMCPDTDGVGQAVEEALSGPVGYRPGAVLVVDAKDDDGEDEGQRGDDEHCRDIQS